MQPNSDVLTVTNNEMRLLSARLKCDMHETVSAALDENIDTLFRNIAILLCERSEEVKEPIRNPGDEESRVFLYCPIKSEKLNTRKLGDSGTQKKHNCC